MTFICSTIGCIFITTLQYCKNAHISVHESNKLMLKYA